MSQCRGLTNCWTSWCYLWCNSYSQQLITPQFLNLWFREETRQLRDICFPPITKVFACKWHKIVNDAAICNRSTWKLDAMDYSIKLYDYNSFDESWRYLQPFLRPVGNTMVKLLILWKAALRLGARKCAGHVREK